MLTGAWPVLVLLAGVLALYVGAELLVAGAGRLAVGVGLRAATVGVTVIAFATTAPELFVAIVGSLGVSTDTGLGTVLGSNIANIGLVLGLTALVRPLSVGDAVMKRHVPFMVFAALLLVVSSLDGTIGRLEGGIFLLTLAGFSAYMVYNAAVDPSSNVDEPAARSGIEARDIALVLGGLLALVLGSRWLVDGGSTLLLELGFSELFVGLTVLALGTSLPELAASVVGAVRNETGFAIGNVVGSNIYNVLAVLGIVALVTPISVSRETLLFELPVLVTFTVLVVAMMGYDQRLSRLDGAGLVIGYGAFIYLLVP
ncbi:sodium:calcium antiporter [Salinadaptatus halalkaliphilus]|uniref:Sodium:calcium antiporter n=1 Tax=Salinadaptatus halalkaliphilus TaxID=2419781 RepID=A0A4S3TQS5_9EURY|nr:calcium/sodium antiporter [Salinadaptatus halalkaliphilus]THE66656.1 sodium:calcium antiporter [Salinadaptatus halalkaliphilus]